MSNPNIGPTRVLQALLACHARLANLTFPASPDTNAVPEVRFMAESEYPDVEYVDLIGKVEDPLVEYRASQGLIEESFELLIRCGTTIPGMTGPDVIARLHEIVVVVEDAFRSPATGIPIPLEWPDGKGVQGASQKKGAGFVRTEVVGFPNADKGWSAIADMYLRVYATR